MTSGMQFTDKASAALSEAQELAVQYGHPELTPVHLAVALLDPQPDQSKDQQTKTHDSHRASSASLFKQVVERAHGDPQALDRALKKALVRLPAQDPPPEHVSAAPSFLKVLRNAQDLSKTQKDSYIAVDHLIQCLAQDSTIQRPLADSSTVRSSKFEGRGEWTRRQQMQIARTKT
jgi:ATP-dependent Clp protease ATP-binding subunit ClpB